MSHITIMRGLPGSGKSTYAREVVEASGGMTKRINRDDLRAMLDNGHWSKENERFVVEVRDATIRHAIERGYDVIVDDTNMPCQAFENLFAFCKSLTHYTYLEVFDLPVEECLRRNALREGAARVPDEVILRMDKQWTEAEASLRGKLSE